MKKAFDNFDLIGRMVDNCERGEFYLCQVIHRPKDGEMRGNSGNKTKTIKSYYISSMDYLIGKKDEIVELCRMFNARAYINLNKKSYKQIALKCLENLAKAVSCEEYGVVKSLIDSACGQTGSCDGNKTWIVDVDDNDREAVKDVIEVINQCEPYDVEKVVEIVPTVHGYHIISRPFNKKMFRDIFVKGIDIHDNNPTLLYYMSENENDN